jgi:hypothetical protein
MSEIVTSGRSAAKVELIRVAKQRHDEVCTCDPKYLMSCPRMAQAILRGPVSPT